MSDISWSHSDLIFNLTGSDEPSRTGDHYNVSLRPIVLLLCSTAPLNNVGLYNIIQYNLLPYSCNCHIEQHPRKAKKIIILSCSYEHAWCQIYLSEGRLLPLPGTHLLWIWRWCWRSPRWIWTADMSSRLRCLRSAAAWTDNRTFSPFLKQTRERNVSKMYKAGISCLEILSCLWQGWQV